MSVDDNFGSGRVTQSVTSDIEILPYDESFDGSKFKTTKGIFDTETVFASIL